MHLPFVTLHKKFLGVTHKKYEIWVTFTSSVNITYYNRGGSEIRRMEQFLTSLVRCPQLSQLVAMMMTSLKWGISN